MVRCSRSLPAAIRPPLAATSVPRPPGMRAISPKLLPAEMPRLALPWPARPRLCPGRCGRRSPPLTRSQCHGAARLAQREKRTRISARRAALLAMHLLQEWSGYRGHLRVEVSRLPPWLPLTQRWLGWADTPRHRRQWAGSQLEPVRPPSSSLPAPLVLRSTSLAQQLL
jgi:hypothetical protein